MSKTMNCPACGAPLTIKNRFVKMVTCDFCGQISVMSNTGLDPTGRKATLVELPSALYIDATGKIEGREFRVMGRLRYQYDAGYWDEWFVTFEGDQPGWLVEDEGTFILHHKQTIKSALPPYDSVRVGSVVPVSGYQVFVTEKREAVIAGSEGQLAFTVLPGEQVKYLDGGSGGELVSIEYTSDEIELLVGREIPRDAVVIQEEKYW
jgi:hypothetical protein